VSRLLACFNICGLSGLETFEFYQPAIDSLLIQSDENLDIAVGGCLISQLVKDQLVAEYADKGVKFVWIDEKVPVTVSFNKTCRELDNLYGSYDGFLYIDSGIIFTDNNDVEKLHQLFDSGPYAMVASRVDHDDGAYQWFGVGAWHNDFSQHDTFFQDDFVMPIGKAWNLHCQIFSRELLDYYGNLYTDIFLAQCSESIFSFICAAIQRKWVISKDVIVHHRYLHNNASSIEQPNSLAPGLVNWDRPYKIKSIVEVMKNGQPLGMGYEQCSREHGVFHSPEDYDHEGYAKNPELAPYIKRYCFLQKDELDYDKLNCSVVC
jgi:hypothetical protein